MRTTAIVRTHLSAVRNVSVLTVCRALRVHGKRMQMYWITLHVTVWTRQSIELDPRPNTLTRRTKWRWPFLRLRTQQSCWIWIGQINSDCELCLIKCDLKWDHRGAACEKQCKSIAFQFRIRQIGLHLLVCMSVFAFAATSITFDWHIHSKSLVH